MNVREIEATEYRLPKHEVLPLLVDRWSPRAMSGQALSGEELASLFEAARWAPSSYNGQPWRFLYARRGSEHWQQFLDLLVDFNRQWADNAAVLIVILSRKTFENNGKPAPTHSFDTGAAWQNLALQGNALGLVVHGMAGFDYDRARDVLDVPSEYDVEAMVAVGRPAEIEVLPEELREQELPPSDRKEIAEIAFHGPMPRDP
jgi:nitroreductase